jgi:hypothetical protein
MADGLSIDYLEDPRTVSWRDNLETVAKNLSAFHDYSDQGKNEETGPGLLVAQTSNNSVEPIAIPKSPNAFGEPEEPVYMDHELGELYDLFCVEGFEDEAQVIFSNGRLLDINVILDPDDYSDDDTDVNPDHSVRHTFAARTSQENNVAYTMALSEETGNITTFVNGKQRQAPIKRDELIGEIEQQDADWILEDRIEDPSQYEWIDIEEELE